MSKIILALQILTVAMPVANITSAMDYNYIIGNPPITPISGR